MIWLEQGSWKGLQENMEPFRKDRKVEIAIDWELELDNTRKLKLPESILEAKASDRELFNMVIDFWNHPSNLMPDISLIYLLLTGKVPTEEQLPIIEDVLQKN